jgi:hypothetical protein
MAGPVELIKGRRETPGRFLLAAALYLAGGLVLHAQDSGVPPGIPLAAEIAGLEQTLEKAGVSDSERHTALVRLALLRQLSGDIESAAQCWFSAAALPGGNSDAALAAGAFCLAAMGEWERTAAAIEPLLRSGRQGPALLQVRYLAACLKAWNSGDASALSALVDNPEYAALRPTIYYTLWKTLTGSAAEAWKNRLLVEFPRSPEGRAADSESGGSSVVSARPSPLWLLLPGRSGFSLAPSTAGPAVPSAAASRAPAKALQNGLFSSEANARVQADRLARAGFAPSVIRRSVDGAEYWAVTVPVGPDINQTIAELKNAGFESFPIF